MSTELTVRSESVLLDPTRFHQAIELAKVMAKADCMPAHLRGKPADCLRVVELAHRANQSPYALADKTYLVQGKIAFEGQLCAALVNAHPSIEQRLNYEYEGDEDKPATLKCRVSAKIKGEDKPRSVDVKWVAGEAQSKGAKDKWRSQPAQQLAYYGARMWARRHTPEILLGMYTVDELETGHIGPNYARDVTPQTFGVARFASAPAYTIDVPDHDPDTGEITDPAQDAPRQTERPHVPAEPDPEATRAAGRNEFMEDLDRELAKEDAAQAQAQKTPAARTMVQFWLSPTNRPMVTAAVGMPQLRQAFDDAQFIGQVNALREHNAAALGLLKGDSLARMEAVIAAAIERCGGPVDEPDERQGELV